MRRIQYFIAGLPFLLIGIFCSFYSKRLASVLIKSTNILNETFNIKRELGRTTEIITQIFLIIFGIIFILASIRVMTEGFK